MNTNNKQPNTTPLAAIVLVLLTSITVHADDIFVSCYNIGTIYKYDSNGNGTVFASGLKNPQHIAFDRSGYLFVADCGSGKIFKIDLNGNKTLFASGLDAPEFLAFDENDNLYVSLQYSCAIEKFDSIGKGTIFFSGSALTEGLAFDKNGNLYAAFWETKLIRKFNTDGLSSVFVSGLSYPVSLAFDNYGNLFVSCYVSNGSSGTIERIDPNGNKSTFADGLEFPLGIAFDRSGNLYVANADRRNIIKFDPNGNRSFFASVPDTPWGIAIETTKSNTIPISDAGPNQVAYAWIDGIAEVNLDGSGSFDDDNDTLTYKWRWSIDGNDYEANGVSPAIELPVGEHTIELVVNDGWKDSEPNYCLITVVEPIKGTLSITPQTINRQCEQKRIMAMLRLPEGITRDQIDNNSTLLLYPGEAESVRQIIIGGGRVCISALFDRDEILEAIGGIGPVQVYVVGQLMTGQYFYGADTMRIIKPGASLRSF